MTRLRVGQFCAFPTQRLLAGFDGETRMAPGQYHTCSPAQMARRPQSDGLLDLLAGFDGETTRAFGRAPFLKHNVSSPAQMARPDGPAEALERNASSPASMARLHFDHRATTARRWVARRSPSLLLRLLVSPMARLVEIDASHNGSPASMARQEGCHLNPSSLISSHDETLPRTSPCSCLPDMARPPDPRGHNSSLTDRDYSYRTSTLARHYRWRDVLAHEEAPARRRRDSVKVMAPPARRLVARPALSGDKPARRLGETFR